MLLAYHHGPVPVLYCTVIYLEVGCSWPTTMDLFLYCTAPVSGVLLAYHHEPVPLLYCSEPVGGVLLACHHEPVLYLQMECCWHVTMSLHCTVLY
jgi:hypothetical protein